jgi:hypothetical protein
MAGHDRDRSISPARQVNRSRELRLRLPLPVLLWLIYRAKKATAIKGLYVSVEPGKYAHLENKASRLNRDYDNDTRDCFYWNSIDATTGQWSETPVPSGISKRHGVPSGRACPGASFAIRTESARNDHVAFSPRLRAGVQRIMSRNDQSSRCA